MTTVLLNPYRFGVTTTNVLTLPGTAGNYVSTPDSAANSISGDLDVRVKVAAADWAPSATKDLISKYNNVDGGRSWRLFFLSTIPGTLRATTSIDGTAVVTATATATISFVADTVHWVRMTRRASDGRIQFFTSDDGIAWTQLGADVTGAVGSLFNSTVPVELGSSTGGVTGPFAGKIYYAEMRNGIGGTVVQSFDATAVTKIGTRDPSTVSAGGPWTINGSAWDWSAV